MKLNPSFIETELVTRPLPKKGENLADTKDLFKTLAESSFTHAVEACAGSEASLLGADNFRQLVNYVHEVDLRILIYYCCLGK